MHICIYIIYIYMCIHICTYIHAYKCLYIYTHIYIYRSIYLCIHLSIYLSICVCIYIYVYLLNRGCGQQGGQAADAAVCEQQLRGERCFFLIYLRLAKRDREDCPYFLLAWIASDAGIGVWGSRCREYRFGFRGLEVGCGPVGHSLPPRSILRPVLKTV